MSMRPFDHERAEDLTGALAAVRAGAVPYRGGTELIGAMNMGLLQPDRLVSLRDVAELDVLERRGDTLWLGAGLTHLQVSSSPLVRECAPLLAEVAEQVGNIRVRATGTLGGNLAFAEPRSDVSTTLLALDARIVLVDGDDQRRLRIDEFILGPYEPDLQPGELVLGFEVPDGQVDIWRYEKVTITERPVVGVALVRQASSGRWRAVIGAVGEVPTAYEADELHLLDAGSIAEEVEVVPDHAGSEGYKRRLVRVALNRCIEEAAAMVRT